MLIKLVNANGSLSLKELIELSGLKHPQVVGCFKSLASKGGCLQQRKPRVFCFWGFSSSERTSNRQSRLGERPYFRCFTLKPSRLRQRMVVRNRWFVRKSFRFQRFAHRIQRSNCRIGITQQRWGNPPKLKDYKCFTQFISLQKVPTITRC